MTAPQPERKFEIPVSEVMIEAGADELRRWIVDEIDTPRLVARGVYRAMERARRESVVDRSADPTPAVEATAEVCVP
jgi:hypothetical protein